MNKSEAIAYIENYSWGKTKLGLSRTRQLLEMLGNPQKNLKFVHVAGSNGKGSTCAFMASVLKKAGYKTGLYTSPYLQEFSERIKINDVNISGIRLTEVTEKVKSFAEEMEDHPTQFELITAIAMLYFYEENVDIVVLEVGMGGEFDSTNIIDSPLVAVITNVGLEHTEYLGDTIEEIAKTKSGIIKPGSNVVLYDGDERVSNVVLEKAQSVGADFVKCDFEKIEIVYSKLSGQKFIYKDKAYSIRLAGEHQIKNCVVAIEAIEVLRRLGFSVSENALAEGLEETRWPARLEVLSEEPLFILDGGHNPQCAGALTKALRDLLGNQKFTFIVGILADKNYEEVFDILMPFANRFICLTPENPRAMKAEDLAKFLNSKGASAEYFDDNDSKLAVEKAIRKSFELESGVIAFGSLYMAGLIRDYFEKEIL